MLIKRASGDENHAYRYRRTNGFCNARHWSRVNDVVGIVRLTARELKNLPLPGRSFIHFNLQHTDFRPGQVYAGLKILVNGHYDDTSEILPTLHLDHWIRLRCLKTRSLVPYSQVTQAELASSDLHVTTVRQLQSAVWRKYHTSLPKLTQAKFLDAGLCITTFKVINRHSSCQLPKK